MAITFPRQLHSDELAECTFKTNDGVALNRTANNRAISAVDRYDPWISATFRTRRLYPAERHAWAAWKESLRGGMKSFLAYDASRRQPINYPNGVPEILAETWDGEGTLDAIAARSVTVENVPTGFKLMPGDAFGLVEDGHYGWWLVTEESTAGVSSMVISVDPYIPLTLFSTAAVAVLYRPQAEFVLDPDSWETSNDIDFAPITFQGLQKY